MCNELVCTISVFLFLWRSWAYPAHKRWSMSAAPITLISCKTCHGLPTRGWRSAFAPRFSPEHRTRIRNTLACGLAGEISSPVRQRRILDDTCEGLTHAVAFESCAEHRPFLPEPVRCDACRAVRSRRPWSSYDWHRVGLFCRSRFFANDWPSENTRGKIYVTRLQYFARKSGCFRPRVRNKIPATGLLSA